MSWKTFVRFGMVTIVLATVTMCTLSSVGFVAVMRALFVA